MTAETVTFDDVLRAADAVHRLLPQTPAWSYPLLNEAMGREVVIKHENTQPTGAFKVRGGLALVASMSPAELAPGLVTASTGNHAQSIAFAARQVGVPAVIAMPEGSPQAKADAVRLLGAEVVWVPGSMTEATQAAHEIARDRGMRYVDAGNTPAVIAGHATVYLELFSQQPDLEALYVPIGSGTGAAGAIIVRDQLAPECAVIGVQSSQAPAAYQSWSGGEIVAAPCTTRHSGLATARGYELPQSFLRRGLADFVLVSDDDIDDANRLLATRAHTLAEGAGAAALAGLRAHGSDHRRVAVSCTGGNATPADLAALSH